MWFQHKLRGSTAQQVLATLITNAAAVLNGPLEKNENSKTTSESAECKESRVGTEFESVIPEGPKPAKTKWRWAKVVHLSGTGAPVMRHFDSDMIHAHETFPPYSIQLATLHINTPAEKKSKSKRAPTTKLTSNESNEQNQGKSNQEGLDLWSGVQDITQNMELTDCTDVLLLDCV